MHATVLLRLPAQFIVVPGLEKSFPRTGKEGKWPKESFRKIVFLLPHMYDTHLFYPQIGSHDLILQVLE